jgi:hypothetical protein
MFNWSEKHRGHANLSGTIAPEASLVQSQPAQHIAQAKWTSTLTNHLLLETGYNQTFNNAKYAFEPEVVVGLCHSPFAQCPAGTGYGSIPHQDLTLGTNTVAAVTGTGVQTGPQKMPTMSHYIQSSLSYVTGAHNLKIGFQQRFGWQQDIRVGINADLIQQYRAGAPTQVTVFNTPTASRNNVDADLGIFVQDTWTTGRLTLNPGLRFDYFNSSIPEQTVPAGRFVPERTFAAIPNIANWKNVSPRIGASYDLFGNGRTAIKGNAGSYVQSQGTGFAATYNPVVISTDTRTWNGPEPRRHRAGERARADQQSELRNAAESESGARHQAAVSVGVRPRVPARGGAWSRRLGQLQPARFLRIHLDPEPGGAALRLYPHVGRGSVERGPDHPDLQPRALGARPGQPARRQLGQQPPVLPGRRRHGERAVARGRLERRHAPPGERGRSPATCRIPTTCGSAIRPPTTCRSERCSACLAPTRSRSASGPARWPRAFQALSGRSRTW